MRPIGKVYSIPPQPAVAENTRYIPAGNVTIGVEYRDLDPQSLIETYKHDPKQLAEMLEKSPQGGFTDEGVSIHVCGTDDKWEYLRFDCFDDEPHYHYVHRGDETVNQVLDYDADAHGEMLPWIIHVLRTRLPKMLPNANGGHLVGDLDQAAIDRAVGEVEQLAVAAQQKVRAARAATAAASGGAS
jgi:hypothetical protein